jgi:hypothetical protein
MAKRPNQYIEAALKVLQASSEPMTFQAITDEAMRRKLLDVTSKTPEASMGAQLYMSVKRLRSRSPFQQTGPGLWARECRARRSEDAASRRQHLRGAGPLLVEGRRGLDRQEAARPA